MKQDMSGSRQGIIVAAISGLAFGAVIGAVVGFVVQKRPFFAVGTSPGTAEFQDQILRLARKFRHNLATVVSKTNEAAEAT